MHAAHASLLATLAVSTVVALTLAAPQEPPAASPPRHAPPSYAALKQKAETAYEDGNFHEAHALYAGADRAQLPPAEADWVTFRLADTAWRDAASSENPDSSALDAARDDLLRMVRLDGSGRPERGTKDRVFAEASESLGDFFWDRRGSQDFGQATPHYREALAFWAASSELDTARRRYLDMIWRMATPRWFQPYQQYGNWYGNWIDQQLLRNALAIAREDADVARAHYLLAQTYAGQGDDALQARVPKEYEAALALGKGTPWHDDALFRLAQWIEERGVRTVDENGAWVRTYDFPRAVELYRELIATYAKGESRYVDDARQRVKRIVDPSLSLSIGNAFLPGSLTVAQLSWRNVERVDIRVRRIDLTRDVRLSGSRDNTSNWLERVDVDDAEVVRTFAVSTGDKGRHEPGSMQVEIDPPLPAGAYVIDAAGSGASSREFILVSDAVLALHSINGRVLAWYCDARDGKPIDGARVVLFRHYYANGDWRWSRAEGRTGADGTCAFDMKDAGSGDVAVFAGKEDRQGLAFSGCYVQGRADSVWRIYTQSDRPAYRPGQEIQWKAIARVLDDARYSTPANQTLVCEIRDPRGGVLERRDVTLNAFGSVSGSLTTNETHPLGEYTIAFARHEGSGERWIGQSTLFRLEEYKLPEFEVKATTRQVDGKPALYRLGDDLQVDLEARTYFGAPVGGATVDVIVRQRPFQRVFPRTREFPWLFQDDEAPWGRFNPYGYGGPGPIVLQTQLHTDAEGRATLTIPTSDAGTQDLEYSIEARVTDASRREVSATCSIKVTRQAYFVNVELDHRLRKPGDPVEARFLAVDANENPVAANGRATLTRKRAFEVWAAPDGRTGSTREGPDWVLRESGYQSEPVASTALTTAADGKATWRFDAPAEGYYEVAWSGRDDRGVPVTGSAEFFVCSKAATHVGYQGFGVEIIVDPEGFRSGKTASILLLTEASGRHVLFTVDTSVLEEHRVVRMDGTAKLIELPLDDRHVPNFFVSALTFADGVPQVDVAELVVPPVEQFLDVRVEASQESTEPGTKTSLTVTTRDANGEPVSTEVSLAVVDAAVLAIQQRYGGDPRAFFHGQRRGSAMQVATTANARAYARLMRGKDGRILDQSLAQRQVDERRQEAEPGGSWRGDERLGRRNAIARMRGAGGKLEDSDFESKDMASAPVPAAATRGPADSLEAPSELGYLGLAGGGNQVIAVRSDFRETALWLPAVTTDARGKASVEVTWPDSITRWEARAVAMDHDARVGTASIETRTRKPLIVRLQAPRFLVAGDEVTLSALVNNDDDAPQTVRAQLTATGVELLGRLVDGKLVALDAEGPALEIQPGAAVRFDWRARATADGTAKLRALARSDAHADAMEKSLPVYAHGVDAFAATSGVLRGSALTLGVDVPAQRRKEGERFRVHVAPSLAVTMLDALPYLVRYPYGCTEQTLSRFLPATIVAKTLKDRGLSAEDAMTRAFGGVEEEFASETHPEKVESLTELAKVTAASLQRLVDFQHGDGGWGWWKECDSDRFMTAYVVWGLSLAVEAGADVDLEVLRRGAAYLDENLVEEEEEPDMQAWMLHALAVYQARVEGASAARFASKAFDNLWSRHKGLNAYSRALFALAAHHLGKEDAARQLVDNLANGVIRDDAPESSRVQVGVENVNPATLGTAHWGEDGIWWRWSEGGVEATAFALRALLAIRPDHELVAPVTNWLIQNRRGAQWSNTRDTAIVVLALNDYLTVSGELGRSVGYTVAVNGVEVGTRDLEPKDLLAAPAVFDVPASAIRDGMNDVVVTRTRGEGPLYASARAEFYSLEEPVKSRGNGVFVRREYFRLVGRPTLLAGYVYDKVPLKDGDTLMSGDRVEVVLTVEAKNHLEYLVFEDQKPAGLEATEVKSGQPFYASELKRREVERRLGADGEGERAAETARGLAADDSGMTGRTRYVYQELRDRKVALFVDRLPEGVWEMRYDLRAESPGRFHALPVLGHAMYVPEIRCNGEEVRMSVEDRPEPREF